MKTVLMTGGTSGLGAAAARRIATAPDMRLLLGARGAAPPGIETLPLDLARLGSVRTFVEAAQAALGDAPIDSLILNAATQFPDGRHRTEDGFETTFAVNHLAHYLILRLLLPRLGQGAVVVITTSDTHDPKTNPIGPRSFDLEKLAHPPTGKSEAGFLAGARAYSSSKLCNMITALALSASPEGKALGLRVIAYNPGLTPGTSLFRSWPPWAKILMGMAGATRPMTRFASVEEAGDILADLALGALTPPPGRIYASLASRRLTWPDPSELARNPDVMNAAWRGSAAMVGLAA